MKKNAILFAIILFLNITASSQLKFVESTTTENTVDENSTRENTVVNSKKYVELNKLGVQKGLIENDYKAALVLFKQAFEENPLCFICRYNIARSHMNLGDFDESSKIFKELIKLDANFADGYAGLGEILNRQKRFEESVLIYKKAVKLNPADALLMNNYANSLDKFGEHKKALKFFNNAIKLNPNFAKAYGNRGVTLYKMKRYKDALKSLMKANEINNTDANIHNSLGVVLDELGKKQLAFKHYKEALRLNPDLHEVRYNLGLLYFGDGEDVLAQEQLKILEKKDFELARRLRKILWSKYVLDAKSAKNDN